MYNSPHETESLARVLPGKLLTLDAQCRKDRGTSACFKDDRVCAQLFCFDAGSGYCVSYRPAAEGSRCGDGAVNSFLDNAPNELVGCVIQKRCMMLSHIVQP